MKSDVRGRGRLRKGGWAIAHPLRTVRVRNGGVTLRVNPLRKRRAKGFTPWRTLGAPPLRKTPLRVTSSLGAEDQQALRPRVSFKKVFDFFNFALTKY
jgi:hypothetical protein